MTEDGTSLLKIERYSNSNVRYLLGTIRVMAKAYTDVLTSFVVLSE